MELVDLKIFVAVVDCSSATRAAKKLGMTQPGVSQHLSRLESEVGSRLFDRLGKKLELNDFGRMFLGKARKLLDDLEMMTSQTIGEHCPIGTVKLGLTDSSTLTVIPPTLLVFRKLYPGIKTAFDVIDSGEIENGVLRGHYDFGIVSEREKAHPLLSYRLLYYDRIDAIVSKKHKLANKCRISLEELAEWPVFLYPRRSRTRAIIDDVLSSKNIHPKEIMEVYFNSGAVRLAESGLGVALLSQAFIMHEIPKHKCVHIRIKGDPFRRAISVVNKRDAHMSDAAQHFYDLLIKSSDALKGFDKK